MKNRELVKKLEAAGFSLERHGSNHDIYIQEVQTKNRFQDTKKLMKD